MIAWLPHAMDRHARVNTYMFIRSPRLAALRRLRNMMRTKEGDEMGIGCNAAFDRPAVNELLLCP
jgi:hypothetical protein